MNFGSMLGAVTSGDTSKIMDMVSDKVADKILGGEGDSAQLDPSKAENFGETPQISGNRKAVLIGINYTGSQQALGGCINDVNRVHEWILRKSFEPSNILILTDEEEDPSKKPTRQNIINAFHWLVQGVQRGDSLFLHYSGHGATIADEDGEEVDNMDSTIVPLDYETAGQITDDEIHKLIASPLPAGARLTSIMDCCHSGSILDLPYTYLPDGNLDIVLIDNRKAALKKGLEAGLGWARGDKAAAYKAAKEAFGLFVKKSGNSEAQQKTERMRTTEGFVVSFSGCMDEQTSADASIEGSRSGAMSWALLATLAENPDLTYSDLLKNVREKLHGEYAQIPQLSTGYPIKLASKFEI